MKWILFRPVPYYQGVNMTRDFGALTTGFREIGEEADYVFFESGKHVVDKFVRTITETQASDPEWWKNQEVDYVLMMMGGRKTQKFYEVVKSSGKPLLVRMDTAGIISPTQDFFAYCNAHAVFLVDQWLLKSKTLGVPLGYAQGYLQSVAKVLISRYWDRKICSTLSFADRVFIEFPEALEEFRAFVTKNSFAELGGRLFLAPPAVCPGPIDPSIQKQNQIVCVGAWMYYVKNPKLVIRTLEVTLSNYPDWRAVIVGPGEAGVRALLSHTPSDISARIQVYPLMNRPELDKIYQESKILLSCSHKEGFPNVVAEAACFGCTSVGRKEIPAFRHLANIGICSTADSYTPKSFDLALQKEIHLWDTGYRNPELIAENARTLYPAPKVASTITKLCSQ